MKPNTPSTTSTTAHTGRVRAAISLCTVSLLALPGMAFAAPGGGSGGGPLFGTGSNFVQAVLDFFTGGFARIVAIIAVIILGILAVAGRLEMRRALTVIFGIILIFGATAIVDGIAGSV